MKSWEVLREAVDRVGAKMLASKLNLSTALVYKWCQESHQHDPEGSGAKNPLDRLKEIYDITQDQRVINWLCHGAGGFFVPNAKVDPSEREEHLLMTTQRVVQDFGELLTQISASVENDGQISVEEADQIRERWESLKSQAECFVVACEQGQYRQAKKPR